MKASEQVWAEWAERVRGWREAGVSAEGYARGKGYSGSALRMWGGRLSARSETTNPRIVALLPRPSTPAASGEVILEVGTVRLRVGPGFNHALLTEVIAVVGAAR